MHFDGFPQPNGNTDVQVFVGSSTVTNTQWRTWRKPPGKTMCSILCIGGGAGGSDEMAQAGGKNAEGVDAALDAARKYLESH